MSKKFKSQASSSRAASGAFGGGAFGGFTSGSVQAEESKSSLSYVSEPPDLSQISDPQVVVAFKNLLKKDSTTKSKALEDLQSFLKTCEVKSGAPEDGFLEAWTSLYPRQSIDASRRVRQLSHTIQGYVVSITGKRVARHMPKVAGPWLAGLYDNDKLVQRAAQDSMKAAFPTEEKRQGIWTVYRAPVLDFVVDAVLQQTTNTLSDERAVSPDEAEAKYARVVASSIQLFRRLISLTSIRNLPPEPLESLTRSRKIWGFAQHDDPFVRRSLYGLLNELLSLDEADIDWKLISSYVLSQALTISQRGSATDFSDLLLKITTSRPQLWTTDYSGRTSPSKRLLQYVKSGSEGASATYWDNLHHLLKAVPREILLPPDKHEKEPIRAVVSLITAFHDGILNKEEPRTNIETAWSAYLAAVMWISTLLPNKDDRIQLLRDHVCPLSIQYVLADLNKSQWTISDISAGNICARSIVHIADIDEGDVLLGMWKELTDSLVENLKISSPEQSQAYKSSQDAISAQATRLFELKAGAINAAASSNTLSPMVSLIHRTTTRLLNSSLDILRSRNGKPYAAASIIYEAADKLPEAVYAMDGLDCLLSQDIPSLIFSPSADRLISVAFRCRDRQGFQTGLDKSIDALYSADPESFVNLGLRAMFSQVSEEDLEHNAKIESLTTRRLQWALRDDQEALADIIVLLQNPASHATVAPRLLRSIADSLSVDTTVLEALHCLDRITSESQKAVQSFATGPDGPKLISKLLYLAESPDDETSHLADSLESRVKSLTNHDDNSNSTLEIVQHSFREIGQESLSLDSLVAISEELLVKAAPEDRPSLLSQLLPTNEQWEASLQDFLHVPSKWSSSLVSPLGGSVYLVEGSIDESTLSRLKSTPRDASQFPLVYRLVFYVAKLFAVQDLNIVETDAASNLFLHLPLAVQVIDDDLSIEDSTGVLKLDTAEIRDECAELVSETRLLIKRWIEAATGPRTDGHGPSIVRFWEQQLDKLGHNSPEAYRMAEAFVKVLSEKGALETLGSAKELLQRGEQMTGPSRPLALNAVLAAYKNSIIGADISTNLCNRLVADLTGLDLLSENEGLRKMTSLNILIEGEATLAQKIPTQRLVFFVKHLIQCLQSKELALGLTSETLKALATVFPLIKEIYGSHWSESLEVIASLWEPGEITETYLAVLHSSFRLFACLRSLAIGESNDDLEEAWIDAQKTHQTKLVDLLTMFDQSFSPDLPWNMTADLLARQISTIGVDRVEDVSHVFSALSVQSRGIQRAAYDVLHRTIPKSQETVSLDFALSSTEIHLPDELISLLVDVPAVGALSHEPTLDTLWIETRCYLLGWKTVFDHFSHSSLPVRERYSADIKEHECMPSFLEFMFDFLQGQREKLIDASKFAIRDFELDQSDSVEKETQWLLIHLYYLCLRYLPYLTKSWWADSKKRYKGSIETWTEKHISPVVIEDSLNDVAKWFSSQDWRGEEQPLQVKVSQKSSEVVASIEIDEESPPASLAIALPPTYPLQQAMVTGRSRVVVDEKKWKAWLLTIQGVIMFSNGNLVDGLLAFRRNVQGALKGQGECIICTSIISTKMQTPNKRCATCKQAFHSDCLFRWFKTSNSSGCPLCRNPFLYS